MDQNCKLRPVSPKKRIELDEIELATRLATGETMRECAIRYGVTGPVVGRRVTAWRQAVTTGLDDPRRVLYWRDRASSTRVARRWLFLQTKDPRWAPTSVELAAESGKPG